MARPKPKWWLYSLMLLMLCSGTANTIVAKKQDKQKSYGEHYNHPYFQTATMFVGELMCLFVYLGDKFFYQKKETETPAIAVKKTGLKAKLGPLIFALPASFDLTGSTLMMIGLGLTTASVYQMLRGLIVVVVAVYSVIFLKRSLYRHQVAGVVLVFIGVTIVGVASVLYANSSSRNPVLGAILIIVGQFFAGGVFVIEEKFFGDVFVPALQAVGIEGASGLTYFLILLPILYAIPCYDTSMCSGSGHVESAPYAFKQLGGNGLLMFTFFAYIFSISFFNWSGISVTKNASSLARSTIDTSRTLLVWTIDLIVGWEDFIWLQLIGFLFLAVGTFIYNEVLIIPWFGFKESVERHQEIMKHKKIIMSKDDLIDETSNEESMADLKLRLDEDT